MTRKERAASLPVAFFARPAEVVAPELLGAHIVSTIGGARTVGRIVETEAYLGEHDPAAHGYQLHRNDRNAALFGPPGSWYVYLSYGVHWCANLVCLTEGKAAAVLVRALEPVEGQETMRRRRGGVGDFHLCSGPGKLCQALGITHALDGCLVAGSPVILTRPAGRSKFSVLTTPRVGITKATDWPLRFLVAGSAWVSRASRVGKTKVGRTAAHGISGNRGLDQ